MSDDIYENDVISRKFRWKKFKWNKN